MSPQQLEHAIANLQKRVDAKTLECASLQQMRDVSADVIVTFFGYRDEIKHTPACDAVHNYLTAKLNWAIIDLEELELNLKMYRQASSGIVGATLMPPNSKMH